MIQTIPQIKTTDGSGKSYPRVTYTAGNEYEEGELEFNSAMSMVIVEYGDEEGGSPSRISPKPVDYVSLWKDSDSDISL